MGVIHVRHPAPMAYRLRRGQWDKRGYAAVETPVRLREAEPRDLVRAGGLPATDGWGEMAFHAFDGALWFRPRHWGGGGFVSRKELLSFLQMDDGYAGLPRHTDLHVHLIGTPVMVRGNRHREEGLRGVDFAGIPVGRVVEDGVGRARADLARFLDGNVLLVDGKPFLRAYGPLARLHYTPYSAGFSLDRFPRDYQDRFVPHARLDRLAEFWAFEREEHGTRFDAVDSPAECARDDLKLSCRFEDFPMHLLGDDDVDLFVQTYSADLRVVARAPVSRLPEDHPARAAEARLERWAALGRLGAIAPDEWHEVLHDIVVVAQGALGGLPGAANRRILEGARRYVEAVALPRLREREPLPQADAEAFETLAPGGFR